MNEPLSIIDLVLNASVVVQDCDGNLDLRLHGILDNDFSAGIFFGGDASRGDGIRE